MVTLTWKSLQLLIVLSPPFFQSFPGEHHSHPLILPPVPHLHDTLANAFGYMHTHVHTHACTHVLAWVTASASNTLSSVNLHHQSLSSLNICHEISYSLLLIHIHVALYLSLWQENSCSIKEMMGKEFMIFIVFIT